MNIVSGSSKDLNSSPLLLAKTLHSCNKSRIFSRQHLKVAYSVLPAAIGPNPVQSGFTEGIGCASKQPDEKGGVR